VLQRDLRRRRQGRTFYATFRSPLPELIDRHRVDIFDELEPTISSAFGVPMQL